MTDSVLRDPVLRDLVSGERAEGTHIVNDMRQRAIRSGSDATRPRYLRHIYKPEKQVEPVKEKNQRKEVSDLDLAINLRPLTDEFNRFFLHPLLQCLILSDTLTGSIVTDILGDLH